MKKNCILISLSFFITVFSFSQSQLNILENFETGAVTFAKSVNINPDGAMNASVVTNTMKNAVNSSDYCWKWERLSNTADWAGAYCNLKNQISNGISIKINYYRTNANSTLKIKLEYNGVGMELLPVSSPAKLNEWETLTYDISGFPNINVLSFFPDYQDPSTVGTVSYMDEIIIYTATQITSYTLFENSSDNTFYDNSWISITAPSTVAALPAQAGLTPDKFPVVSSPAHSTPNAIKLQWTSATSGNWIALVAAITWKHFDLTNMNVLSFWVNPSADIPKINLPKIYLESHTGSPNATGIVNMSNYVSSVNLMANTWKEIVIPLQDIWNANTAFTAKNDIKGVFFAQNTADNTEHSMYMDDFYFFNSGFYRSATSGNWNSKDTWQWSYDGTNYDASLLVPSSISSVAISSGNEVTINANSTANNIDIQPKGKLTLNSGVTLYATTLDIKSDATGTGTFVDKNTGGGLNTIGISSIEQYLSSARNWYISSPVSNAVSSADYYRYSEPGAQWITVSSGAAFNVGTGYIAHPTSAFTTIFNGNLNCGDKSIVLTRTAGVSTEGYNLVGNPYPSYLNINNFSSNSDIEQTYWYRSFNGGYVFDTYNISGGVGTNLSGKTVNANIPPMQAFWLRVVAGKTAANVTFLNSNRLHQDNANNVFRVPTENTNRILRLNVSNGINKDEAILYFNENAADNFDAYDSEKMSNGNASIPEIYTVLNSEKVVINGMNTVPYNEELSLGFITEQANNFNITASEFSNFNADMKIILKDKTLNTETDLTKGSYSFSSDIITTNDRFSLIFRSPNVPAIVTSTQGENIHIFRKDKNKIAIHINEELKNANAIIYNTTGQQIIHQKLLNKDTEIDVNLNSGIFIVKAINGKNSIIQKIIIE